jgi:uncharacterized protein (DUF2147 family)
MKSFFVIFFYSTINLFAASSIVGTWWSPKKDSKIEIFERDNLVFGKIIWLSPDVPNTIDARNPIVSLQTRPILGIELLTNFKSNGDNNWSKGQIYDPESGKTYSCKMELVREGELKVRGYIGISLFGRTETFLRVK